MTTEFPPGTRVALVTGAAHGIGAAIAQRLHQDGYRVVLLDRDACVMEQAAAMGALARGLAADVACEGDVQAALRTVAETEGRLDALVCNAGIMIRKPLAELALDEWSRVIATNLTSTYLLAREAAPLLARARGAIVTIASTRARMSEPDTESYAASKGGLVALSHALAISLGPAVRVNAVSPGWIDVSGETLRPQDHAQHPAGRVGRPDDVASLVAWLVHPAQEFVTGGEFVIDGGMTRKMIYDE
jgi:NAD(P)-dependent dehydrogenase (short-subunit alcohol dehydrogenase family)